MLAAKGKKHMLSQQQIKTFNQRILKLLSFYLNTHSDFIEASIIDELVSECGLSVKEAFALVLAEVCGLDLEDSLEDRLLYETYFLPMLTPLDSALYTANPYYQSIHIPAVTEKDWCFTQLTYKPYEAFVYNDLKAMSDGRILPQIGFFSTSFSYPAVLQNQREWMLITPNEIETMQPTIYEAYGKVLTYGLGLGYFAYMVAQKETVTHVTIIEKDEAVIQLFKTYILPQFDCPDKIEIICEDAFTYAEQVAPTLAYDFIFADIWHDVSDGVPHYLRFKALESLAPQRTYRYWIEPTIIHYLD